MKVEVSESLKPDEFMLVSWPTEPIVIFKHGSQLGIFDPAFWEEIAKELVKRGHVIKVTGVSKP